MKNPLSQFSTEALEQELLNRQKCHFGRLSCAEKAEEWIIKPFNYQRNPTCFICQQRYFWPSPRPNLCWTCANQNPTLNG